MLYILALLDSAQTLQVLQTELGLPFKVAFCIVMSVFVVLGVFWDMERTAKKEYL